MHLIGLSSMLRFSISTEPILPYLKCLLAEVMGRRAQFMHRAAVPKICCTLLKSAESPKHLFLLPHMNARISRAAEVSAQSLGPQWLFQRLSDACHLFITELSLQTMVFRSVRACSCTSCCTDCRAPHKPSASVSHAMATARHCRANENG